MSVQRHQLQAPLHDIQIRPVDYSPITSAADSVAFDIRTALKDRRDAYAEKQKVMNSLGAYMDDVNLKDVDTQNANILAARDRLAEVSKKAGVNSPEYNSTLYQEKIGLGKYQAQSKTWASINDQIVKMQQNPPPHTDMNAFMDEFRAQGEKPLGERNFDLIGQSMNDPKYYNVVAAIIDARKSVANVQTTQYPVDVKVGDLEGTQEMTDIYDATEGAYDKANHQVGIFDEKAGKYKLNYSNDSAKMIWDRLNQGAVTNYIIAADPKLKTLADKGYTGAVKEEVFNKFKDLLNNQPSTATIGKGGQWTEKKKEPIPYPNSNAAQASAANEAKDRQRVANWRGLLDHESAAGAIGAAFGGTAKPTPEGGWSIKVKGVRTPYIYTKEDLDALAGQLDVNSRKANVGAIEKKKESSAETPASFNYGSVVVPQQ